MDQVMELCNGLGSESGSGLRNGFFSGSGSGFRNGSGRESRSGLGGLASAPFKTGTAAVKGHEGPIIHRSSPQKLGDKNSRNVAARYEDALRADAVPDVLRVSSVNIDSVESENLIGYHFRS